MTAHDLSVVDADAALAQLKIDRERYEIVAELSDDVVYEYDVARDTLFLFSTRFGGSPDIKRNKIAIEHWMKTLDPARFVHPDDLDRFLVESGALANTTPESSTKYDAYSFVYRLLPVFFIAAGEGVEKEYVYQRVLGRRIFGVDGKLAKFVGKIVDVSEEYALMHQSCTDGLTGAYNRSYLQDRIREYCLSKQPDVSYACLLADVDYFKSVNDQFGHLAGDSLLTAFVDTAHALFRTSDVVARLGGDEFMVLMRDVYDPCIAQERSEVLIESFRTMASGRGFPDEVSLSVGVVVSQESRPFSELYYRADIALYCAKAAGKNRAVSYVEGMVYPQGSEAGK